MPHPKAAAAGRDALRERLLASGGALDATGWLTGDDGHELRAGQRTPAAVLVGLVARPHEPHIILTQRTAHLRDHAGQISLPGGRIEQDDAGPAAAALREALEEIGLDPVRVELLGGLRHYDTITGFRIHPIVGWIEPPVQLKLDPFEVADAFELPMSFVMDPHNHRRESLERDGQRRHFFVLPYEGRHIWGATAGILVNFARLLAD